MTSLRLEGFNRRYARVCFPRLPARRLHALIAQALNAWPSSPTEHMWRPARSRNACPSAGTKRWPVYHTGWAYVLAAIGVSAGSVLAVLPLYAGWVAAWAQCVAQVRWKRRRTMGAPLLMHVNSNADRASIVKAAGEPRARYSGVSVDRESESDMTKAGGDPGCGGRFRQSLLKGWVIG